MGGRRSRPIYKIIRRTKESEKKIHDLTDSIAHHDIKGIASISGSLFNDTIDFAESFIHAHSLLKEIGKEYRRKLDIPQREFEVFINREWSKYSKKHHIKVTDAAKYNIIHAVSKAIKGGEFK